MAKTFYEVNFDGLSGPSHFYGGLAKGNIASQNSKGEFSSPKAAALQMLEKAWLLAQKGLQQAILPPHPRPLSGNSIQKYTSSFMWAANSATVIRQNDKLSITPANMSATQHRNQEHLQNSKIFKQVFGEQNIKAICPAQDEGAANHMLLTPKHGQDGLNIFVYGVNEQINNFNLPKKYPARQSKQAAEAIINQAELKNAFVIKQNAVVIDAGVFHNDVIATANENVLLVHEQAFEYTASSIEQINNKYRQLFGKPPIIIQVSQTQLSVEKAVSSYLFNSQILTLKNGEMLFLAPKQVQQCAYSKAILEQIIACKNNPINKAEYVNLSQSMANGGGPACLRLRVTVSKNELEQISQRANILLNNSLYNKLKAWIEEFYLAELSHTQLMDKNFTQSFDQQNKLALQKLEQIMELKIL